MAQIELYDTTLRDGAQGEGISFSLADKLRIARTLADFGIAYIEGGWPGSNPKDAAFFEQVRTFAMGNAKVVAFGSTRRASIATEDDANLKALLDARTPAVALVGKSSQFHVRHVLETTASENLAMISDSVRYMKQHGKEVVYDAEHFFDGYREDAVHALETLRAAVEAGADWVVLCDTNGGSMPNWIRHVVAAVGSALPVRLGIHTHNDCELAVANALAAVEEGCTQVQGTINGYGERCGNCNLVPVIANLQLKMGHTGVPQENLSRLSELAHKVAETANAALNPSAAYVGRSAFAHKGGIHVAAVEKATASYEHVSPQQVGNARRVVVSELSGRGNLRVRAAELGFSLDGQEKGLLQRIKELESRGFQFEVADGSLELMLKRSQPGYVAPFELLSGTVFWTRGEQDHTRCEATVRIRVSGEEVHTAAVGNGPVHALDRALRKALLPHYPQLAELRLEDYKVRILDPEQTTGATTRVLVEAGIGSESWITMGCSENILEASCQALLESLELPLARGAASLHLENRNARAAQAVP